MVQLSFCIPFHTVQWVAPPQPDVLGENIDTTLASSVALEEHSGSHAVVVSVLFYSSCMYGTRSM